MKKLSVQEEIEVEVHRKLTDSIRTTPSYLINNMEQSTMEAFEQDMRRMGHKGREELERCEGYSRLEGCHIEN